MSDQNTPTVQPTSRTDDVISGVRANAAAYDDCILRAGAQARESVERGIIGHAPDGTPTPPDPSLLRGTNAEITPEAFLLAGIAAQLMIAYGDTPHPALGGISPNTAIRLVRN